MSSPKYSSDTWALAIGEKLLIHRVGTFLKCLSATARFDIAFGNQNQFSPETQFRQGLSFRMNEGYDTVLIHNTNTYEISVELAFGDGDLDDNSLILESQVSVETVSPDTISTGAPVSLGAGATGQLVAANSARSEVLIKNLSTTERVWVQGAAVAAAEGFPLDGKEGLVLTTSAAVRAYNPSGVAIDVAILETVKSS
ncbi:MAG: hypothetical protein ACRBBO_05970 [Cognatishimia sp.]